MRGRRLFLSRAHRPSTVFPMAAAVSDWLETFASNELAVVACGCQAM
jgi:hypothetical protein